MKSSQFQTLLFLVSALLILPLFHVSGTQIKGETFGNQDNAAAAAAASVEERLSREMIELDYGFPAASDANDPFSASPPAQDQTPPQPPPPPPNHHH